ncbi:hypothetical protein BH11BAC3_BH11BAC3_06910 [soil metagenome]
MWDCINTLKYQRDTDSLTTSLYETRGGINSAPIEHKKIPVECPGFLYN